ncbi:hypothetical protein RHGRI_007027 [Rhododendron griersonianum]|uniref:Uncharacterized protein n=1 Tax=Rhododendron griersonianum TaxID=479676 RepID=A0AAV6KWH4_9ERIC|nr:hypothetical protein RHGRI_007027 [Rhododendron griersonianum]KAG5556619.1 hypothetical protein RHGRI_007027 [Rhododendron griersonianum]
MKAEKKKQRERMLFNYTYKSNLMVIGKVHIEKDAFELKSGVATSSFEVITSFDSLTISISLLIPSLPIPVHIRLRLYVSPSIWASGPRNRPHMGHRPGPIGWAIRLGPVRLGLGPICPQPQRPPVRVGRVGVGAG